MAAAGPHPGSDTAIEACDRRGAPAGLGAGDLSAE